MKKLLVIALSVFLIACKQEKEDYDKRVINNDKETVSVTHIATVEGCNIYHVFKFNKKREDRYSVYFTKCENSVSRTEWSATRQIGRTSVTDYFENIIRQ